MTSEGAITNKGLVRRFYKEVYVDWNMALADQVLSPRFISHDWARGGPTGSRAFPGLLFSHRSGRTGWSRYEVDDLIAEDDKVVVRWRLLGTHKGNFQGIAPTGRAIVLKGIAIYGWRTEC